MKLCKTHKIVVIKRIPFILRIVYFYRKQRNILYVKKLIKQSDELNIIIGSSGKDLTNWISTEQEILDITKINDWKKFFDYNSITRILSEHVLEHLTIEKGKIAVGYFVKFLKLNGRIRIAVPDANHPSKYYHDYAKPGGFGAGAVDHKVFFDYISIIKLFENHKEILQFELLEYYDGEGLFHSKRIDDINGKISRTHHNKRELPDTNEHFFTSLIIDIFKIK